MTTSHLLISQGTLLIGLLTSAMSGFSVLAQQPLPQLTDQAGLANGMPLAIARNAIGLHVEANRITALGANYKAYCTAGAVEFVPALGEQAPHNQSLTLRPQSLRRGTTTVALSAQSPQVQSDNMIVYEHGGGLLERFEVRADGIEHSFVFSERPAGNGDLVVRIAIDTELACATGQGRDELQFTGPFGGVHVGGVVGIDADGVRTPGTMTFDGSHVDYVLPAGAVDSAAYPLVLDPFLTSTFSILTPGGSTTDRDVDVACDSSSNLYVVVWERVFSLTDIDVIAHFVDPAGSLVGSLRPIDTGTDVAINPAIAAIEGDNDFIVVWQRATSPFGPWSIRARALLGVAPMSGTVILATSATLPRNPDVGAVVLPGGLASALAVWESDVGLRTRKVEDNGGANLTLGATGVLTNNATDHDPAISQTAGASNRYLIAWEDSSQRVRLASTDPYGNVLDTFLATGSGTRRPAIDGDGTDFLLVYEKRENGSNTKHDVYCRALQLTGSGTIGAASAAVVVDGQGNDDQIEPAVAFLGDEFLVAWNDEEGTFNYNVYSQTFTRDAQVSGQRRQVSVGTFSNFGPAIGSRYAGEAPSAFWGNSDLDQAMVAFHGGTGQLPFQTEIRAKVFEAIGAGGNQQIVGAGCGAGGTIGTNGPFAVGNQGFGITVLGVPQSVLLSGITLATAGAPTQTCGPCSLPVGVSLLVGTPFGGGLSFGWAMPNVPAFTGISFDSQWFHLDSLASGCPLLPQLTTSGKLRLTLGL